jgi:tetratricopeptide (TPR) repeat protein
MFAKMDRRSTLGKIFFALCATAIAVASLTGCSGMRSFRQAIARNKADDVSPTRKERQSQIARDFDKKRDDTQFDAAASSWERGDPAACELTLQQLLERNPKYRRAHLLLADLYLFNGQTDRAIDALTKAVALDEKDPVAQHSLAQALDAAGLRQEAVEHYQLATQLQPTNELYALSFKTALGVVPPSSPDSQPLEMLASATNQPIEPERFKKQVGVTIENARSTMSPMVAKMPALARTPAPPSRGSKSATSNEKIIAKATANEIKLAQVIEATSDGEIAISDSPAAEAAPFSAPQLAMANAGGALPSKSTNAATANGPDGDPAWRLNGSVRDSKRHNEFATPTADLDAWVRPVHFDAKSAEDASATESQASAAAPPQVDSRYAAYNQAMVQIAVPAQQETLAEPLRPSPPSKLVAPVVQAAPWKASDPQTAGQPLGKAVESLALGDTNAAIDAATRGLSRSPEEAGALYRVLGTAHYRQGEYEAAQAALAQALSLDKTDALAYFLMGSTLAKLNEPANAARYFSEAARLDARYAR